MEDGPQEGAGRPKVDAPAPSRLRRHLVALAAVIVLALGILGTAAEVRHRRERADLASLIQSLESEGKGVWPEDLLRTVDRSSPRMDAAAFDGLIERIAQSYFGKPDSVLWMDRNLAVDEMVALAAEGKAMPLRADLRAVMEFPATGSMDDWIGSSAWMSTTMESIELAAAALADSIHLADAPSTRLRALELLAAYVDGSPATSLINSAIGVGVHRQHSRALLILALHGALSPEGAAPLLEGREDASLDGFADALRAERLLWGGRMAREALGMGFPGSLLRRSSLSPRDAETCIRIYLSQEEAMRRRAPGMTPEECGGRMKGAGSTLRNFWLIGATRLPPLAYRWRAERRLARTALRILLRRNEEGRLPSDREELRVWLGEDARSLDADPLTPATLYDRDARGFRLRTDPATRPPIMGDAHRASHDPEEPVSIHDEEVVIRIE